jgi:hypothetical protein
MSDLSELDGEALLRIARELERFDAAWERGEPIPLEDLLREATDKVRAELLKSALVVELTYRRARGESPTLEEYRRRFPEDLETIRAAFAEPVTITIPPGSTTTDWPPAPGSEPLPERIGKYIVVGRLGTGGQGETFLARDPDLGRLVVLKRYHASAHDDVAIQEAQALTRIRSRHTAECFNLERDGDALFQVMEYIPGRCLSDVVKERPLVPGEAARLVEQVAEGVEAVHACGLVHRDLKPSNIVLGDDSVPRLVDFGLAAHLGSPALRGGSGTPPYMAPEQARDQWERIDFRSDIYGLGAVLYALLTGQPPHPGKTQSEALEHARQGVVTPPRARNRSIPRPLERIVLRALAADPAQRFATAAELRQALRRYRLRHWYRVAAGLAIVLVLARLIWAMLPEPVPPLEIAEMRVVLHRRKPPEALGVIGSTIFAGRYKDDDARVHARLTVPGYCYLIALNPDGKEQLCLPQDDSAPPRTAEVDYPPDPTAGFGLTDGVGLQSFVLVASREPLPLYRAWRARLGGLPWRATEADWGWRFDGQHFEALADERGTVRELTGLPAPFVAACRALQHGPGVAAIRAVAFPVRTKQTRDARPGPEQTRGDRLASPVRNQEPSR